MGKKSFAVLGAGRFGRSLAEELDKMREEVIIIDKNEAIMEAIAKTDTAIQTVIGNYIDESVLRAAGVQNVDTVIIAASGDLSTSILAAVMLREMGIKEIIAKAADKVHAKILEKLDVNMIVMPEHDMGKRLANKITSSNFLEYIEVSDSFSIAEIKCPKKFLNKSIKDIDIRNKYNINVIAVANGDDVDVSPSPNEKFKDGDVLIVVGSNTDIENIRNL